MRIRVIDLETTGDKPPEHAVIEIGWTDLHSRPDLTGEHRLWDVGFPSASLIRPGRTIPADSSAIHHLVDEDVANAPRFETVYPGVLQPLTGSDSPIIAFAAHMASAEQAFITAAMAGGLPWICTYKSALRIFHESPRHSNQALRYHLRPIGLDRALATPPHRGGPDSYVTAFLLRELLEHASIDQLVQWTKEPALQIRCFIGKIWRGHRWTEVDDGFLEWFHGKDFDEDVMFTVRHEQKRREEERRMADGPIMYAKAGVTPGAELMSVIFNGVVVPGAVEADVKEGWVVRFKEGPPHLGETEKVWGRVEIVRQPEA